MKNKKSAPKTATKKALTGPSRIAGRPFTTLVILSTGDELRAAEAEMRLRTVTRHFATPKQMLPKGLAPSAKAMALPPIIRVAEVPDQADATALALYRSFRALGRSAPTLYLCAGSSIAAPVMLQTDWGNTVLTTQDGTLGLLTTLLSQRQIPHSITPLNTDLLLELEQIRMDNPEYSAAEDNPLRDILAPAAAALLAGVAPGALAGAPTNPRAGGRPSPTVFQGGLTTCQSSLKTPIPFTALKQADGSYLTNLTLDPLSFSQWQDDTATFTLALNSAAWHGRKPTLTTGGADTTQPCIRLSAHWAPVWDERFLALHLPNEQTPILHGQLTRTR